MTPEDHAVAAADLLNAEKTGEQIGLLTLRHPEMGMDDAYEVQNAIYRAKLAEGRKVIGWKIGLTSKAMQYALNIDIPDSGILFDDMAFANGATVPAGRFIQPRIEAEIAFVMKSAVGGENVTREDVIAATDYVAPSIEILDTRIQRVDPASGKARTVHDTISDNAANAGIVLGGESMLRGSLEYRYPLVSQTRPGSYDKLEMFRVHFFLDAGVLGTDFDRLDLNDYRAAYGFGFALVYPIPLAFNFGWPLQEGPGDETQVFSFNLAVR